MRVCSEQFVNGVPSDEHPNPELKLGHTNITPSKPRAKRKLSETTIDCSKVSEDGNNCSDDPRTSPKVGVLTIAFKLSHFYRANFRKQSQCLGILIKDKQNTFYFGCKHSKSIKVTCISSLNRKLYYW